MEEVGLVACRQIQSRSWSRQRKCFGEPGKIIQQKRQSALPCCSQRGHQSHPLPCVSASRGSSWQIHGKTSKPEVHCFAPKTTEIGRKLWRSQREWEEGRGEEVGGRMRAWTSENSIREVGRRSFLWTTDQRVQQQQMIHDLHTIFTILFSWFFYNRMHGI